MRNCHRSAVSSPGAELGAGGSRAVKQAVAALWAARIYAPQEQLYLSSVKSLIYRETPSGKAISLEPATLGIYNCSARESSSLPSAGAAGAVTGAAGTWPAPRNGCLLPQGIPRPQHPPHRAPSLESKHGDGKPVRGTAGSAPVRNTHTCLWRAKGISHGKSRGKRREVLPHTWAR